MINKRQEAGPNTVSQPAPKGKVKIALVGAGIRGTALLQSLCDIDEVVVVGVADRNPNAPGLALAANHNVQTFVSADDLLALDVDVIIEVTDDPVLHNRLASLKRPEVELIGDRSALFIWRLLEARKKGQETEKLLQQLSEAYDQISVREQELKRSRAVMEDTNRELERHLAEIFFVHEFFKALARYGSSVEEVANLISDGANGILGVELSCVYLLEKETQVLRLKGFQGRDRGEFKEVIPLGQGLVGRAAQANTLIDKQDPEQPGPLEGFMVDPALLRSQAAVPLMVHDNLLGVMAIGQTTDRQFTERELSRAEAIGHMASLAMQNAIFNSELERLSVTDRLTELYNHGYFQQRLEKELSAAARTGQPVSLLMLDIDLFKEFNDTFGHPKGDQVLKRVARLMMELVRQQDTVARYGGEEFCVIVPATNKGGAITLATRMREAVESERFEGDESRPSVQKTVSIGVATYPEDGETKARLIEHADRALYRAKRAGRNQVISA